MPAARDMEWIDALTHDSTTHHVGRAWVTQLCAEHTDFPANRNWKAKDYRPHLRALATQQWTRKEILQATATRPTLNPYLLALFGHSPTACARTWAVVSALHTSNRNDLFQRFSQCSRDELNGLPLWALDETLKHMTAAPQHADETGAAATFLAYVLGAKPRQRNFSTGAPAERNMVLTLQPGFYRAEYARTPNNRLQAVLHVCLAYPGTWSLLAMLDEDTLYISHNLQRLHTALLKTYPWTGLYLARCGFQHYDFDAALARVPDAIAGPVQVARDLDLAEDPVRYALQHSQGQQALAELPNNLVSLA